MGVNTEQFCELTQDDKFLIELLVDGELEEPQRKDLLIRLEQIDGGWRFCAITFLEAQCLHEVVSRGRRIQCSIGSDSFQATAPDHGFDRSSGSLFSDSTGILRSFEGNAALALDSQSQESSDHARPASRDPFIIPMKQGKGSGLGRSFSSGGDGGNGSSWKNFASAMVGGFLLAFLTAGILFFSFFDSDSSVKKTPVDITHHSFAPDGNDPSVAAQSPLKSNGISGIPPVRLVTLQSKRPDLNGITVPYIESSKYDPEFLKSMRHLSTDHPVEKLRKAGHQVETVYEDIAFPLDNDRTLILPVDTYRIRYHHPVDYQ
ncbi:MAG: hypothetical protein Q4G69_12900 [Planctomycetia bacterium]|nr:hypothetical protein [Planctomycetia bacterium]